MPNSVSARGVDTDVIRPQRPSRGAVVVDLLVSACAWIVFFYWWAVVARANTALRFRNAAELLVVISLAIVVVTFLWIRHNIRIAKRGKRGFTNRWTPPVFVHDYRKRPLVFAKASTRREARWVVVRNNRGWKHYDAQELFPFFRDVPEAESS